MFSVGFCCFLTAHAQSAEARCVTNVSRCFKEAWRDGQRQWRGAVCWCWSHRLSATAGLQRFQQDTNGGGGGGGVKVSLVEGVSLSLAKLGGGGGASVVKFFNTSLAVAGN